MHQRIRNRLALFILIGAASLGTAADLKPVLKTAELNDGDTLVFLGDSITHQCQYTQFVEDFFYTRFPTRRIRFHNAGVSGDRCADALKRFDGDVARYKPKYVTVLLGMNDGRYQPFNQEVFDTYERDMLQLIEKIKAIGATPILMTPTMFDSRQVKAPRNGQGKPPIYYNGVLAYFGSRLRETAVAEGFGFVNMYGPLNDLTTRERKTDPNFTLVPDAVHPVGPGQFVMAAALIEDIGLRAAEFEIDVKLSASSDVNITAQGQVGGSPAFDGRTLSFTFRPNSLPWVVTPDAELGRRLTSAGHRFSREALKVSGLPSGRYELQIDGVAVGDYAAEQLAAGVELQDNAKTPQYQRALEIAKQNQQRNKVAVTPLRNLWLRRKAKPNDVPADFDKQVADLEAKAKTFEDKIYTDNQPSELRFQMTRKQ